MILVLEPNTQPESVDYRMLTAQLERLSNISFRVHREVGTEVTLTEIYLIGNTGALTVEQMQVLPCVAKVVRVSEPYRVLGRHAQGDDRLSSTRPILQFLARDIALLPAGGLNIVDARDVAALMPVAMARGTAGARYLVGAVNWTFAELFGRLERLADLVDVRLVRDLHGDHADAVLAGELEHVRQARRAEALERVG